MRELPKSPPEDLVLNQMIPSSFRLGREVVKTLHKLSREVGMSCFVCFVLRLKNREKERKLERCTATRLHHHRMREHEKRLKLHAGEPLLSANPASLSSEGSVSA